MKKKYYAILSVALALSMVYDRQILLFITAYRNPILTTILKFLTDSITYLPIPLIILSAIMFYKKTNKKITAVWFVSFSAFIASYAIKYAVGRVRPDFVMPLVHEGSPSFPSAHAAVSFAPVQILSGKLKWVWVIFAVLVAYSRMYLGVHYMSDVIGGIILGCIMGDIIMKIDFSRIKLLKKLKIA